MPSPDVCVSNAYSSATRDRSASCPFVKISTSQSIAHLFALGEELIDQWHIIGPQGVSELAEPMFELGEGGEDGVAIVLKDRRPDRRVAGRDARRGSKPA